MAELKVSRRRAVLLLLLSGIPTIWFSQFFCRESVLLYRAQQWQAVTATIRSVTPGTLPEDDGEGHTLRDLKEQLEYFYDFAGVQYVGEQFSAFESWNVGSNLRGLSTGSNIKVYVNPDRPSEAILHRDLRSGFGIVLVLTLLAVLWLGWALLAILRDEKFTRGFLGHTMVFVSALIFPAALFASGNKRDTNWWLVAGGFLGAFAVGGLANIAGLWSRQISAVLTLLAILGGLTTGIVGLIRGGVRG